MKMFFRNQRGLQLQSLKPNSFTLHLSLIYISDFSQYLLQFEHASMNATNLDVLTISSKVFNNANISTTFAWMVGSMVFNSIVVFNSLNGWLISPRITRHVVVASSLAIVSMGIYLSSFFAIHRSFSILIVWLGYPRTLLIALQHIELLKLFASLSNFWTERRCRIFQGVMIKYTSSSHFRSTFSPWG